jgi:hypothetical protein
VRLVFDPSVPSPVAIGTCLADYGGLGAIEELRPGYTVLSGLTIVFPNQFPPGAQRTALATTPVPGSSGRLSTGRGAGGLTVIDIDVKDLLLGALNRRDATFGLMLDATSETLLTTTAKPQAVCRTFVEVGSLTVGHL